MRPINLECPYCGEKFDVCAPEAKDVRTPPLEVACTPYTRDIGRFDPGPTDDIYAAHFWSRIGKDYLQFLSYEKVGILRIARPGINVQYRAQRCPNLRCGELFDVYANYTKDQPFEKLWPHLFGREADGKHIKLYQGENYILWFIRSVGKIARSDYIGILAIGIIIFLAGSLPYLLWADSGALIFRLSGWIAGQVPNVPAPQLLKTISMVLYGMVAAGVMVVLALFNNYVRFLRGSTGFTDLFKLKQPEAGVTFWKNYTSARCTGVQNPQARFPRISQGDVFSGGTAILLALILWFSFEAGPALHHWKTPGSVIPWFELSELLTWLVIAYFLASAIGLAMGLTFYVLNGVRKIPMKISPFDHFGTARPLRELEQYSVRILLSVFVVVLLTLSALQLFVDIPWVVHWFEWAVALLFVTLGFGLGVSEYLVGAFVYFVLWTVVGNVAVPLGANAAFSLNSRLIILGIFFTFLMAFQLISGNRFVTMLLVKAKNEAIRVQKDQLETLNEELSALNARIAKEPAADVLTNLRDQRQSVYATVASVIGIIEGLEKIEISGNLPRKALDILTPVVSSVVLPLLLDAATKLASKSLGLS